MFCPSCGFEYTHKTNYCKRCGGDLNGAAFSAGTKAPRFSAFPLFAVVALFVLGGLFLNILSYHILVSNHVAPGDAFLSFAMGLLLIGGIAVFLMRQMSRLLTAYQKSTEAPPQERVIIREIQNPQLGTTAAPVGLPYNAEPSSVVEHTTRSMANVSGDRSPAK
jgi:hypothetical protein